MLEGRTTLHTTVAAWLSFQSCLVSLQYMAKGVMHFSLKAVWGNAVATVKT